MLSSYHKGTLYVISSGILYGLLGYFGISLMKEGMSVSNMSFWRFFLASISILPIFLIQYKKFNDSKHEMFKTILYGIFFYGICAISYFFAAEYIGTAQSMVIFYTYPAMVVIFNYIVYKTPIRKSYYFSLALIFIGIILLIDIREMKFDLMGIGLSLISALTYCFYIIFSKKQNISPLASSTMVSLGCLIASALFVLADNSFYVPYGSYIWLHLLGISILCSILPIFLMLRGLQYISAEDASIFSVLEPVFVVLIGITILGEHANFLQICGIVSILLGALIVIRNPIIRVQD